MKPVSSHTRRQRGGFSLVELAVVLVIIGLIVGGVLKGQELVTSAQINAVQTDANKIRTAVNTFRNKFLALPGDIQNPDAVIDLSSSGLSSFSEGGGNDNGQIEGDRLDAGTEAVQAWAHLGASGLLNEIDAEAIDGNHLDAAEAMTSGIGGFYSMKTGLTGSENGTNFDASLVAEHGIWLMLGTDPIGDGDNDDPAIAADNAAELDRKIDDGDPVTGDVIGNSDGPGADQQECINDADRYAVETGTCAIALKL